MPAVYDAQKAQEIIESHMALEGSLLPILHAFIEEFGFIDDQAVPQIANALNLTRAEVHGVVTFYHDFRREPAGRHVLKICQAEACRARGCEAVAHHCLDDLGVEWHGTTADGAITVEPVYCLGLCANGPAALFDEEPIAALTADKLVGVIEEASAA